MKHKFCYQIAPRLLLSLSLMLLAVWQPAPGSAYAALLTGGKMESAPQRLRTTWQAPGGPAEATTLDFIAIPAGRYHSCGLTNAGGLKCWGDNIAGQLGDGTTLQRSTPVNVSGLTSGVLAAAAGDFHTCALTSGGGVKCWGYNASGQLGDGTSGYRSTPVDVSGLTSGVTAITAGVYHTCALTTGGGVKCWGYNYYGQLGDNTTTDRNMPVDVVDLTSGVAAIVAGDMHTCAVTMGGGVKCWGYNNYGQLGDDTTVDRHTPVNVVSLSSGVAAIAGGGYHTCALTTGGGVKCWGNNWYGQLGDGTWDDHKTPVEVSELSSSVTAIASGVFHSCALVAGGGLKCWGDNWQGQLGDGTTTSQNVPTQVSGLTGGVTAVGLGYYHTCAALAGDGAKCWGHNGHNPLGDGAIMIRSLPVEVSGLDSGMTVISSSYDHTCAVTASGGVKCWGDNSHGQLGDGTNSDRSLPVEVSGLANGVSSVSAGRAHTCALTTGGGVKCWGYNYYGQLGNGTWNNSPIPVDVSGLTSGVAAIAAGGNHTCALTTGGGVKCWGYNTAGQLGDGTTDWINVPVDVNGLTSGVKAIAASFYHTCALTTSDGVKCWGANGWGQLGDGTNDQRNIPVDVSGLTSGVSAIASTYFHTCAAMASGGMKCWGNNWFGQLGDGTASQSNTPVDVLGLTGGVAAIAAGNFHTCAVTINGAARCWGYNYYGQLGDGSYTMRYAPSQVSGLSRWAMTTTGSLTAGFYHTCALVGNGRAKCWGNDGFGQLGAGAVLQRETPVYVLETAPPVLLVNYANGYPGSIFTFTGWNYPAGAQATLTVNSQSVTTSLEVNPSGSFVFFLDTAGSSPAIYNITVSTNPSASTSLVLENSAPLRLQEGGGQVFYLPGWSPYLLYIPLVQR